MNLVSVLSSAFAVTMHKKLVAGQKLKRAEEVLLQKIKAQITD